MVIDDVVAKFVFWPLLTAILGLFMFSFFEHKFVKNSGGELLQPDSRGSRHARNAGRVCLPCENERDDPVDAAGGPSPCLSARDAYSIESHENGGSVRAGSEAAAIMSVAATPEVRRSAQKDGGYTPKGGKTAKLASRETARKRPRRSAEKSASVAFEQLSETIAISS